MNGKQKKALTIAIMQYSTKMARKGRPASIDPPTLLRRLRNQHPGGLFADAGEQEIRDALDALGGVPQVKLSTPRMVPLSKIVPGEIIHETLPGPTLARIERVYEVCGRFMDDGEGLPGWVDSFRRELDPELELGWWETTARRIACFERDHAPDDPKRVEAVYIGLLALSTGNKSVANREDLIAAIRY